MHILACSRTPKALLAPNVSGCFGYCGTCLSERSQREAFPQALAQWHGCEWHLQTFTVWSLALTHFLLPSFSFNKHSTHTHIIYTLRKHAHHPPYSYDYLSHSGRAPGTLKEIYGHIMKYQPIKRIARTTSCGMQFR